MGGRFPILRLRGETLAHVWARRALSFTIYFAAFNVYFSLLPLLVAAAVAVDLVRGGAAPFARTRVVAFTALYLACEVWGLAAAAVVWLWTGGGRSGHAGYLRANQALQRYWSEALFRGALVVFGIRLTVEGDECVEPSPFLLFVRHSSLADTVIAASLVANRHDVLLKYVLKRELLWDPCLDVVGRRLPNAFVDRTGARSEAEIAAVVGLAGGLATGSAVLVYPEGTRFSPERRDAAVRRLREQGRDELAAVAAGYRHVLPPKLGGPLGLIERAPGVDVVFLEHTGFEGARGFEAIWRGELVGRELCVRLRRVPAAAVPAERRDVWLFEQWAEVDRWIDARVAGGARA